MKRIDGEPVANGMKRLRIEVTRSDIEKGQPMNPNACAIARACIRQVKNVVAAKVHKGRLYLKFEGQARWQRWTVPEYATREIVAFDRGGRFVPQMIDFNPPPFEFQFAKHDAVFSRGQSAGLFFLLPFFGIER